MWKHITNRNIEVDDKVPNGDELISVVDVTTKSFGDEAAKDLKTKLKNLCVDV